VRISLDWPNPENFVLLVCCDSQECSSNWCCGRDCAYDRSSDRASNYVDLGTWDDDRSVRSRRHSCSHILYLFGNFSTHLDSSSVKVEQSLAAAVRSLG